MMCTLLLLLTRRQNNMNGVAVFVAAQPPRDHRPTATSTNDGSRSTRRRWGWWSSRIVQPRRCFPGKPYAADSMEEEMEELSGSSSSSTRHHLQKNSYPARFVGRGREIPIFDNTNDKDDETTSRRVQNASSRGGAASGGAPYSFHSNRNAAHPRSSSRSRRGEDDDDDVGDERNFSSARKYRGGRSSSSYGSSRSSNNQPQPPGGDSRTTTRLRWQPVTDWWSRHITPNLKHLPKIQCRVEPTTTLKIRKTFRPLKTIVRLSAHFNTQQGVWQFQSSWYDSIIGSKLTLVAGKELQLAKSWQLSVGLPSEDLVTRLRLRAAVDLQSWKAYVRIGFRTERLSPINVLEGFSLLKQIPLDGHDGHIKLEVKANFALPEPEIEYSTETQRSLIGMGDIEVGIEELNLLLDY